LARAFTSDALARLAAPGAETRLRQGGDGVWRLTDLDSHLHRADFPWTREWAVETAAERPVAIRIEALYGASAEKDGVRYVAPEDFCKLTVSHAKGVKADFAADSGEGTRRRAFRLVAENLAAMKNGAWASARYDFPFPGLKLDAKRIAFGAWVKGDGSGALLNLQIGTLREFNGGHSDYYVRLDFTGWKYITFFLRERDAGDFHKYDWPYGRTDPYVTYRYRIKTDHHNWFAAFLNDIPKGGKAAVEIGEIKALEMLPFETGNASVSVGGLTFRVPFKLVSGEYAELDGGSWTHYSALGAKIESVATEDLPRLYAGLNRIAFSAVEGDSRAEVTLFALSNERPAFVPDLSDDMKKELRYEALEPFEYAPSKGLSGPAVLPVRPGERALLSFEIVGPVENPTFRFKRLFGLMSDTCVVPVKVAADETLVCRDGKRWQLKEAKAGKIRGEGELSKPMPILDKSRAFEFTADVPEDGVAVVDILKEYVKR